MKNKHFRPVAALMLCMGIFLCPVSVLATSGAADTTPPSVNAWRDGDKLHIEASDDHSGIDAVFVDGKRINYLIDGAVEVKFQDYGKDKEQIIVYAVDFAGNKSVEIPVENPGYQPPKAAVKTDIPIQSHNPNVQIVSKPADEAVPEAETMKPPASASADPDVTPKPLSMDGSGAVVDNATEKDGKEFYTINTPSENVFYLVIDKQRSDKNVYFLNEVTEDDLTALAKPAKTSESAVPEPEPVCSCKEKCVAGEVNTDCAVCEKNYKSCAGTPPPPKTDAEPESTKKNNHIGTVVLIGIAVIAAAGAGYYFKIMKPKQETSDDFEDSLEEDEDAENDDDYDISGEPDYQEDTDEYEQSDNYEEENEEWGDDRV